jgi:hypothetical protein
MNIVDYAKKYFANATGSRVRTINWLAIDHPNTSIADFVDYMANPRSEREILMAPNIGRKALRYLREQIEILRQTPQSTPGHDLSDQTWGHLQSAYRWRDAAIRMLNEAEQEVEKYRRMRYGD